MQGHQLPRRGVGGAARFPAALECKLTKIVPLDGVANIAIFGEVIGIYMDDDCIVDGMFDITKFTPVGRLGYRDYADARTVPSLYRDDSNDAQSVVRRSVSCGLRGLWAPSR